MFHSIRWRIALPYTLLILLTMIGVSLYVTNFIRQTYLRDLETELVAGWLCVFQWADILFLYEIGMPGYAMIDNFRNPYFER